MSLNRASYHSFLFSRELSFKTTPSLKLFQEAWITSDSCSLEELTIFQRVSDLPTLRELEITDCQMLESVEKLESLQRLKMIDKKNNNLPEWLISFLQQCEKHHDNQFHLYLECSAHTLKGCLKGHPYWVFFQQVHYLEAYGEDRSMYLNYTNESFSYQTNLDKYINGFVYDSYAWNLSSMFCNL